MGVLHRSGVQPAEGARLRVLRDVRVLAGGVHPDHARADTLGAEGLVRGHFEEDDDRSHGPTVEGRGRPRISIFTPPRARRGSRGSGHYSW
nr:hypothetical protein KitaXyl93_56520 [Kitasatospora sp. Xyl93]